MIVVTQRECVRCGRYRCIILRIKETNARDACHRSPVVRSSF